MATNPERIDALEDSVGKIVELLSSKASFYSEARPYVNAHDSMIEDLQKRIRRLEERIETLKRIISTRRS